MRKTVTCSACQFEHPRRPDGICPRCAKPADPAPAPVLAPELTPLSKGARLAGVFLVVNALAAIVETALGASSETPGHSPIVAAAHDVIVGAMLMRGERKVLRWSIFRVCAGAVLFTFLSVSQRDFVSAGFQVALSASLLLLLVGTAARPRIATAAALFATVLLFETTALIGLAVGRNILAMPILAMRGEIESAPKQLTGAEQAWAMATPAGWYLRPDAVARRDNPVADRWLIRPDLDAHIMVIAERLDAGQAVDPDALAQAVLENAKARAQRVDLVEQGALPRPRGARMLHVVTRSDAIELEFLYGIVASGSDAYQIVGFAPRKSFRDARPEVEAAIASFVPAASQGR